MTADVNAIVAKWLRERHPAWTSAQIGRSIAKTYVIDQFPNWSEDQIEREVTRRLAGEQAA